MFIIVIDCGPLPAPDNGEVELSGTIFTSVANYSCNEGYILNGTQTRFCTIAETWSGVEPVCGTLMITMVTLQPGKVVCRLGNSHILQLLHTITGCLLIATTFPLMHI